jgi:hypothetical protein
VYGVERFEIVDILEKNQNADKVRQIRAEVREALLDLLVDIARLFADSLADDVAIGVERTAIRHEDVVAGAKGATVSGS